MEFGRLPSVDQVDFTLPPDAQATTDRLAGLDPSQRTAIYLGTPMWADPAYVGTLYPRGTKSGQFLARYGEQLNTVELNTTYYRVDRGDVARWADAVPDGFRFCPKVHQIISHQMRLRGAEVATERFLKAMSDFGAKLGPIWMLLPPEFGPRDFPVLEAWVRRFGSAAAWAIELRHPDWFRDPRALSAAMSLFDETGVSTVLTDVAGRRDVLHQTLTTDTAFLRFVGNGLHPTDHPRGDDWIERLSSWTARGLRTLYLFLHQPDERSNVEMVHYVAPRLAEATGCTVVTPKRVAAQRSLFGDR